MTDFSRAMFDLVDRVVAAAEATDVWNTYLGETSQIGLTGGYVAAIPQSSETELRVASSAMPKHYLEGYLGNELYAGDMVLGLARSNNRSFEWKLSDWPAARMTPLQQRWREHLETFGISSGTCVLDFRPSGDMFLMTCGSGNALSTHDRLALYFVGQEVIHRVCDITGCGPTPMGELSQRERECLQWAAAGKTDWEIGQILSLSEKTVNVYIDRAKSKFRVKSRAQAVVLAARSGLITI